jgi:hypothetical protein
MAETGKGSDHMREKDAQHTTSARVRGVGWASASAGHDQEVCCASRGERTGKHEAGMELPEWPRWLHAPPENPRCRHRRVLDARDAHGTKTVTSSWDRKTKRRGESLWRRPPGGEKWRGHLCGTMWNGRGRTPEPHHMHARDTGDAPGKRCVSGAIESRDPAIGNSCEVQEANPASMEDREEMVLRIPRNPAMQWPRAITRAPSYKCPGDRRGSRA